MPRNSETFLNCIRGKKLGAVWSGVKAGHFFSEEFEEAVPPDVEPVDPAGREPGGLLRALGGGPAPDITN